MATATHNNSSNMFTRDEHKVAQESGKAAQGVKPLLSFWTKINNDWIFNLSSQLAYNFLMSAFPILLVLLAIGGFILGTISPGSQAQLTNTIAGALPGGTGRQLMVNVTHSLHQSATLLLIVGIVLALISGSGLFLALENCMGVVFKLRGRNPIRQRLMAFGMLLLYTVLIPIIILATIIPATIARAVGGAASNPVGAFFFQVLGVAVSVLVAAVLFGAIYVVVPNRPVRIREVWKGTLTASVLLVIYDILFPLYVSTFLHPQNYGSTAGFAVVILIFFYYLGFILLLGAEINSWAAGQRETAGSIVAILHEVQAHNTTRGAAGPTAGMPQEDLHDHKGAAAMRTAETAIKHEREDHHSDETPPKFAESGVAAPGFTIEPASSRGEMEREGGQAPTHTTRDAKTTEEALQVAQNLPGESATEKKQSGMDSASDATQPTSSGMFATSSAPVTMTSARTMRGTVPTYSPLTPSQRQALNATLATSAVAVAPMVAWIIGLARGGNRREN